MCFNRNGKGFLRKNGGDEWKRTSGNWTMFRYGKEGGYFFRNPPSFLSSVKFPLLVLLPKVDVGGRDVVGIEFFVFSEVY